MSNRTPVPKDLRPSESLLITEPQFKYIQALVAERDLSSLRRQQVQWLAGFVQMSHGDLKTSRAKASEIIGQLKELPKRPTTQRQAVALDVPAGRYAIENTQGELRFYQVWRPKDNSKVVRVYVFHGPDSSPVHRAAEPAILEAISEDVRGAAIRYGNEIGSCSNCGRRLTNRISRELGIGPVCGGRMFASDDWSREVKEARKRIIDRGEDPSEEIE